MKTDVTIGFLAELGVGLLLFHVGLKATVREMLHVGPRALVVAVVGVVAPFILGTYLIGPLMFPGLSSSAYLFLGATLTATSVGITARVLQDLGRVETREAQVILGAAVIDDILGLMILAVVVAIVKTGTIGLLSIGLVAAKALIFLVVSVVIGHFAAPTLSRIFSTIHSGYGMKLITALLFFFTFAYGAELVGLAPIVGAFAGGLVLEGVHFVSFRDPEIVKDLKEIHGAYEGTFEPDILGQLSIKTNAARNRHIEELVESLVLVFTPIFFILTGMRVDLSSFSNLAVLSTAAVLTASAVVGKLACGLVSGRGVNRLVVGFGMVPRGEVGLIFANAGLALGVISSSIFSAVIIMVMVTTLVTPPILAYLIRRSGKNFSSP